MRTLKKRRYTRTVRGSAKTFEGACAKVFMAWIKSGEPLNGRVASFRDEGTWVEIKGIGVEPRQVLIARPWPHINQRFRYEVGEAITLQCVPDPARPGKYKFIVLEATDAAR